MISFKISKKQFLKESTSLFKNISKSSVLHSLEYVRFESDKTLKILSTDLETSVTYDTHEVLTEKFSFCADGDFVNKFISKSLSEEINISVKSDRVTLESGGFKASYSEGEESMFPIIKRPSKGICIVNSVLLLRQLKNALISVSNDDLRPSMTGVFMEILDQKINIVSTDAHRLYYNSLSSYSENYHCSFIVPSKTVKILIESFKEEEPITIYYDEEKYISFKGWRHQITCNKIDAKYPNYESIIPDNKYEFFIIRKDLKSFLLIANQFVNKSTKKINLTIQNGNIFFSGGVIDFDSEFEYKIPLHGQSDIPNCRFAVNSKFLLEALSVNKKDHAVSIKHSGEPYKSMIIDSCFLLMPIMIND